MPKRLTLAESRPLDEAASPLDATSGQFRIQVITPGWGSSGHYSAQVLQKAAVDRIFPAGTHMYIDHPGRFEEKDRPERTLRDLAAVLTTDAEWDGTALMAEAHVYEAKRRDLAEMREHIGVSIRGWADTEYGEAEGRHGNIVKALIEGTSIDFVTHAGRGGRIVEVLEGAPPAWRTVEALPGGMTVEALREALQTALREANPGDRVWVYVRDFDDTLVWFQLETPDESTSWQQPFTVDQQGVVTLSGDPVEVRAETTWVPVTPAAVEAAPTVPAPAGQAPSPESQEDTMPENETGHAAQLAEATGRVTALESERDTALAERDTAVRERDEARAALTDSRNAATAQRVVSEVFTAAGVDAPKTAARVASNPPLDDAGAVDEAALRTLAEESASELAASRGLGKPHGLGSKVDEAEDAEFASLFPPQTQEV